MAKVTKEELKNKFKAGSIVSQQDFQDLIDSCYNLTPEELRVIYYNFLDKHILDSLFLKYSTQLTKFVLGENLSEVQSAIYSLATLIKNLSSLVTYYKTPPLVFNITENNSIVNIDSSNQYYFKLESDVNNFLLIVDGLTGVSITHLYNISSFNDCKININITSDRITTLPLGINELYVTNNLNFLISGSEGNSLFTIYYFNTGSSIFGVAPNSTFLPIPQNYMFLNPTLTAFVPPTPTPPGYGSDETNVGGIGIGVTLLDAFLNRE